MSVSLGPLFGKIGMAGMLATLGILTYTLPAQSLEVTWEQMISSDTPCESACYAKDSSSAVSFDVAWRASSDRNTVDASWDVFSDGTELEPVVSASVDYMFSVGLREFAASTVIIESKAADYCSDDESDLFCRSNICPDGTTNYRCRTTASAQASLKVRYYFPYGATLKGRVNLNASAPTGSEGTSSSVSMYVRKITGQYSSQTVVSGGAEQKPDYSRPYIPRDWNHELEPGMYEVKYAGRTASYNFVEAPVTARVVSDFNLQFTPKSQKYRLSVESLGKLYQYGSQDLALSPDPILLRDKDALVEVTVALKTEPKASEDRVVPVQVRKKTTGQILGESFISIAELYDGGVEEGKRVLVRILDSEANLIETSSKLEAIIDPDGLIEVVDEKNKIKESKYEVVFDEPAELKLTISPFTGYCKLFSPVWVGCSDAVDSGLYSASAHEMLDFAERLYPNKIESESTTAVRMEETMFLLPVLSEAFLTLEIFKRKTTPLATHITGMVNSDFFNGFFGQGALVGGVALPNSGLSFILAGGNNFNLAHELGHNFGAAGHTTVDRVFDGYDPKEHEIFTPRPQKDYFSYPSGLLFTPTDEGDNGIDVRDIMTKQPNSDGFHWWGNSYSVLKHSFVKNLIDPPLIVIAGLLNKEGEFLVNEIFQQDVGYLTPDQEGSLHFSLEDGNGVILATTSINPNFSAFFLSETNNEPYSDTNGEHQLEYSPIVVALPALANARRIIVKSNDHVIESIPVDFSDNSDEDGDGVDDHEDACPNSDLNPTIVIGKCDSGVENSVLQGGSGSPGCTISDRVVECEAGSVNHGDYVSCVAGLTNFLKSTGGIGGLDKGKIQRCAAKSVIGK